MQLSDKTKIGMTIGQLIATFIFVFAVGGGYADLNTKTIDAVSKAAEAKSICDENRLRLESIEKNRAAENLEIMKMIQEIRESQIRIEGKLDLKQDRFK